ncbi:MAG: hypothetical protein P9X24_01095 [Candidatus Hatepunaea meridiana]|nr:hypothetical protein [Candidatus Hatepunaea meridiana]
MTIPEQSKYQEADLSRLKTFDMSDLERKVEQEAFAKPLKSSASFADFTQSLPDILTARDLRKFANIIAEAANDHWAVIVMFGGHVIKTGLAPLLIDQMKKGVITTLATNGSGTIHDTEIALFGRTSEDVAEGLADGSFGMSRDTADFINNAISDDEHRELGYGEALGKALIQAKAPFSNLSLLCNSYQTDIPLTVHVALGTDIIHQHPSADGEAIGHTSMRDFRIFAHQVGKLDEGGVVINIGSAVIMPEVFLKALTVARNLGYPAHGFTAANFDMYTHYRPTQNVLNRPTLTGGRKFNFIGHHEIMIPLLFGMVNEEIEK